MSLQLWKTLWLSLVYGALTAFAASSVVIGVARSGGAFFIDNASVPGVATLFDGSAVRTAAASSDIILRTGERVTLAPNSSARLYRDRFVLESGLAELRQASTYRVEAAGLRIDSAASGSRLRVASADGRLVRVAVAAGSAEVRNATGLLVARVLPGVVLQLHSAAAASAHLTGIVETQGGRFFLTDETTKVKVELRGSNLKSFVGKRVQVVGSAVDDGSRPAAGASQVVAVSQVAVIGVAGPEDARRKAAGGVAGGAAAGAAGATGVSSATVAVIGGVAAAATVGGLAAAGTIGGSDATVSR